MTSFEPLNIDINLINNSNTNFELTSSGDEYHYTTQMWQAKNTEDITHVYWFVYSPASSSHSYDLKKYYLDIEQPIGPLDLSLKRVYFDYRNDFSYLDHLARNFPEPDENYVSKSIYYTYFD